MFSHGSTTSRASVSLGLDLSPSFRSRPDQAQVNPPSKASIGKAKAAGGANERSSAFRMKGGKRHHAYDEKDAPYPFNYESRMVDVDALDHIYYLQSRKSVTWVDFKGKPPTRSLDLGCGTGAWILDAAKEWKDCHFVGFDLVPIQPSLHLIPARLASRIKWVHGNFLTGKLPFEDNYFDHVHVYHIAWGIGEMHWDALFEEIARVLCPGGAIEVAEEDILFPTLPRSYTLKGKQPRPSAPYPRPSLTLSPPPSPLEDPPAPTFHAHALLESLFFGVFESRMINRRPTAIIPHHLNIHFRNVLSTPRLEFPFPPPPIARQQLRHVSSDCTARPRWRQSDGSESSVSSSDAMDPQQQTPPATNSSFSSLSHTSGRSQKPVPTPAPTPAPQLAPPKPVQAILGSFKQAGQPDVFLLPPVAADLNDQNLALQLNSVYIRILACKEAMWEELRRRVLLRRTGGSDLLRGLGWDDDGDDEDGGESSDSGHGHGHGDGARLGEVRELERARARFEELTVRFERDLRYRTALADALEVALGWKKPAPAPLSKHERARQMELDRAIAEAARAEAEQGEQTQCSRSFKGFVGFKEGKR